ncbi:IS3 family transposase [Mesobacillus subterraneus]|uniref:IS3 family transposase n=1 Tax=Mesobacillus subterraneus TaxID=285983 RepID=UPI00273E74EA|nr:IS3 family transposase [Mesobacillus subterraneus]WLR54496.1 IS3 family transposase [Mesobacillus subterraneus]
MSKRTYSFQDKIKIVEALKKGSHSISELKFIYKVNDHAIYDWVYRYEKYGAEGLKKSSTWKRYSKELKLAAVQDYLSGDYSQNDVIRKYEISCRRVLQKWINKYNSHRELKDTSKGRTNTMTRRNTTINERKEIVLYCLENGKDYQKAAETFKVSYQQAYQWVKKYEDGGEEALRDKRGRKKEEVELSPEQKMKLEMKRLASENERLRAENLFPKKVRGDRKEAKISQIRLEEKYIAIKELHEEEGFSFVMLCEIAGLARSAYYKWLKRTPSKRECQNVMLVEEMKALHEEVKGIYGYRRITMTLNRRLNKSFNEKRIYRLMKIVGIQSVIRKKKNRYKKSTPQHVAENVLDRNFQAESPNEKWVTDVTEFKYGEAKKAYLSAIKDLHDGAIVSYVFGHSNNNKLVFDTLDHYYYLLNGDRPLIHSDRGFQYTHFGFKQRIDQAQMTQSMSRVGRCIDNGPMESFWGSLKSEKYYMEKYKTFEELSAAIDEYIYFYNHERYQKRLNGLSPLEFRAKAA